MKTMCIGGGPAGLYFAISAKLRDAGHDITVIERDPAARSSMAWFQHADRYLDRDAVTLAYAMSTRHGAQPPWRYQIHLATQIPAIRTTMRAADTARRWYLARRRGQPSAPLASEETAMSATQRRELCVIRRSE